MANPIERPFITPWDRLQSLGWYDYCLLYKTQEHDGNYTLFPHPEQLMMVFFKGCYLELFEEIKDSQGTFLRLPLRDAWFELILLHFDKVEAQKSLILEALLLGGVHFQWSWIFGVWQQFQKLSCFPAFNNDSPDFLFFPLLVTFIYFHGLIHWTYETQEITMALLNKDLIIVEEFFQRS